MSNDLGLTDGDTIGEKEWAVGVGASILSLGVGFQRSDNKVAELLFDRGLDNTDSEKGMSTLIRGRR